MKLWSKAVIHGVMGSILLSLVYFGIVGYVESFNHAIGTFFSIAYLMIPLIISFGVQIGLFSYSRQYSRMTHRGSASVTASGGLSTGSMIACCIHHVTDVIPIIGIAAVASVLTAFQPLFITIGLLSNMVGILTILGAIQRYHLYDSSGILARIMHHDIKRGRNYAIVLSSIIVVSLALIFSISQAILSPTTIIETSTFFSLPAKTIQQGGLTIGVAPLPFNLSQEVKFQISFDTHAGSLDFDVVQAASLEDDHGNTYKPIEWSGSPPGGHHREGIISFPPLSDNPHSIKLVMIGINGVNAFVFDWKLTL